MGGINGGYIINKILAWAYILGDFKLRIMKTTNKPTRPMYNVISLAEYYGYVKNDDLPTKKNSSKNLWYIMLDIKEWLYDVHSIWTWVTVRGDFTFIPYYRDLRMITSERKALRKCLCNQEALMTALTIAIKQINN